MLPHFKGVAHLLPGLVLALTAWPQTITTVAGNGAIAQSNGDGGPATKAAIGFPLGVAVDSTGNIFIADGLYDVVRKVDAATGIITTYAGSFTQVTGGGDGGPAVNAGLGFIGTATHQGIAVDSAGNLYITDAVHSKIRKVDTRGIITTVAGNGTRGLSGDGGPATNAEIATPYSVAVDGAGNLYICDTGNGRIRKVDAATGNISTLAGTTNGFNTGDGGPAANAQFANPADVAVDSAGNVYVADAGNSEIREISGGTVRAILSHVSASGVAVDKSGNVYVAAGSLIMKVTGSGISSTAAGGGLNIPGDGGAPTDAGLGSVTSVTVDTDGNYYFGDKSEGRVRKVTVPPAAPAGPPALSLVANAFGDTPTIAPNMWVEIKGTNLSPVGDTRIWRGSDFVNNQLPAQLDGVSVKVNGKSAFIYYISPTQVNILTPPDALSGSVQVQFTNGGGTTTSSVQAQTLAPSLFTFDGKHIVGTHLNGLLLGPASLYPGLSTPAQPGETIIVYGNGFGQVSAAVVSGATTQSGTLPTLPSLTIGGAPAQVTFGGLISPGLFQFNVVVPNAVGSGDAAVSSLYSGSTTQSGVVLTVQSGAVR